MIIGFFDPVRVSRSKNVPVKNVPVKQCPGQTMSRSNNVQVKNLSRSKICPGQNITFKISPSECPSQSIPVKNTTGSKNVPVKISHSKYPGSKLDFSQYSKYPGSKLDLGQYVGLNSTSVNISV